jgi:subtilisin family serine protease
MKKPLFLICALLMIFFVISCGADKSANVSNVSTTSSTDDNIKKADAKFVLSQMGKGKYKEGELLVKFKSGVVKTASTKVHQSIGASTLKRFQVVPELELVQLPAGTSIKDAVTKYMSDPLVEYAEPNYIRKASATIPNDQFFSQQWALHNTGTFAGGFADADIDAIEAWDITTGSSQIIIAVLDTGIDFNHADLSGNICLSWEECRGWNFVANNNPMDDHYHGTFVSGIIGAKTNNFIGIAGMMWNVKIMPVKFLDRDGEGTVADEIASIQYAISKGAKIINASYSGDAFSQAEYDAIAAANAAGVLLMAAAGNGGDDDIGDNNDFIPQYPASYSLPNILAIAATDQNDRRASFSNFGLNTVHVAAPGVYILSTIPTFFHPSGYFFLSGTSASTPHVSGLAGLLYTYYSHFTPAQIRGTILRYVDVLPTLSGWIQTGGRINGYRAISSLLVPTGLTAAAVSSSQINLSWTDNATGEDGYKIERMQAGSSYSQIATTNVNATTYQNSGLRDGTSYTYRVRAYNTIPADSLYSNEATAVTPLNPPTNVTATAVSTSQINLSWTDNSQAEDGYKIERKPISGGDYVQIATVGQNVTSYSDTGLATYTTYFYRVRAFNAAAGNSAYSIDVSATTHQAAGTGGGGGGGCSIRAKGGLNPSGVDIVLMALPLLYMAVRRIYKGKIV